MDARHHGDTYERCFLEATSARGFLSPVRSRHADVRLPAVKRQSKNRILAALPPDEQLMGQYTQVFIAQMVRTTGCNVLHPVQQRCARWLHNTYLLLGTFRAEK